MTPISISITATLKASRYRFLWLKGVRAFNEAHHCAKCLIGKYNRDFSAGKHLADEVITTQFEAMTPFYYLCGVTPKWAENLHIAMRPEEGGRIEFEDGNIRVVIEGAIQLSIPEDPLPFPKKFATCRNFRFGYHYLRPAGRVADRQERLSLA